MSIFIKAKDLSESQCKEYTKQCLTKKSSYFGGRLYLAYDQEKGWGFEKLGFFERVVRKLFGFFKETHSATIKRAAKDDPTMIKVKGMDTPSWLNQVNGEDPNPDDWTDIMESESEASVEGLDVEEGLKVQEGPKADETVFIQDDVELGKPELDLETHEEVLKTVSYSYEGSLKNGIPHGKGEMKYNDGTVHKGEFKDGLLSGKGVIEGKLRSFKYEGDVLNGKPHGQGKLINIAKRVIFTGSFQDGLLHGQVKEQELKPDGDKFLCTYENGNCKNKEKVDEGVWEEYAGYDQFKEALAAKEKVVEEKSAAQLEKNRKEAETYRVEFEGDEVKLAEAKQEREDQELIAALKKGEDEYDAKRAEEDRELTATLKAAENKYEDERAREAHELAATLKAAEDEYYGKLAREAHELAATLKAAEDEHYSKLAREAHELAAILKAAEAKHDAKRAEDD